jgi:hypothetical protein
MYSEYLLYTLETIRYKGEKTKKNIFLRNERHAIVDRHRRFRNPAPEWENSDYFLHFFNAK